MHIKKVFAVLIDSYPREALEKLEEVSYLIKKGDDMSKFLFLQDNRDYKAQARDIADYMAKVKAMNEKSKPNEEEDEGQPAEEEVAPVGMVQDLMKDIRLFAWAGVGFG